MTGRRARPPLPSTPSSTSAARMCCACIAPSASAPPRVAKVVATLREQGAMDYTVVVVTEGNDPPGLAYIAPYAATSIAEYFMEAGARCADRL